MKVRRKLRIVLCFHIILKTVISAGSETQDSELGPQESERGDKRSRLAALQPLYDDGVLDSDQKKKFDDLCKKRKLLVSNYLCKQLLAIETYKDALEKKKDLLSESLNGIEIELQGMEAELQVMGTMETDLQKDIEAELHELQGMETNLQSMDDM